MGYHSCEDDEFENNINFTTVPRIGTYNAFSSGNSTVYDFDDRWRFVFGSKYSLLQILFLGMHDIKVGVQTDILAWDKVFGLRNMVYYDLNEQSYNPD